MSRAKTERDPDDEPTSDKLIMVDPDSVFGPPPSRTTTKQTIELVRPDEPMSDVVYGTERLASGSGEMPPLVARVDTVPIDPAVQAALREASRADQLVANVSLVEADPRAVRHVADAVAKLDREDTQPQIRITSSRDTRRYAIQIASRRRRILIQTIKGKP